MEAKAITFLGDEGAVQIPFFQRGYVWEKINWEDMLTDLLEFNKSHFLGSLILKQLTAITGEQKSVLVIDGQQRLTTLSILLKFIYELFTPKMKRELKYNYSLEHIMPQKWEEYWHVVPVYNETGVEETDHEKAKSIRYSKIYSLGNMTLLNSRLNTSLRNFIFKRKIEGEGRKKGIRHYSELWITKSDIIDKYDNGEKIWNEVSI